MGEEGGCWIVYRYHLARRYILPSTWLSLAGIKPRRLEETHKRAAEANAPRRRTCAISYNLRQMRPKAKKGKG